MSAKPFQTPNAKEIAFLKTWKQTRLAKWKYILATATMWGVTTAALSYLLVIGFRLSDIDWLNLCLRIFVFSMGGIGLGYWLYVSQERRYQQVMRHAPECLED